MAYVNDGIDQRAEVAQGLTDSVVYHIKANGAPVAPDANSAWVTVLGPGGDQKIARTQAGVAQNSDGRLTYTRAWATADFELLEDYILVWEWQESTVVKSDRQFFDVVIHKLPCLIDTSDIQELYPDIASHLAALADTDAQKFIRRAWSMLMDRIRSGGNRPSLILDRVRLVNPAIHLATHFVCAALSRDFEDIWDKRQERHLKMYETLMAGLGELRYDRDQSGTAGTKETQRINKRSFTV